MSACVGLGFNAFRVRVKTLVASVLMLTCALGGASARELRIVTIESAPFGFIGKDGQPTGMMYEIGNLIAAEAGFTSTNQITPYARSAHMVARGEADFVLRYTSTELTTSAIQVAGVLRSPNVVLGKPTLHLKTLADLHGKWVGTPRGGRFDEAFEADARIFKYPVTDYTQMLKMLLNDRIDAAMGSSIGLFYNAQLLGIHKEQLGVPLVLSSQTFELHFSRKTADEATIAALKAAVARLKSRNEISKIIDKYLGTYDWELVAR